MRPPVSRFEQSLQNVVPEGARGFLLAVSGGADSTALVRLFADLRAIDSPVTRSCRVVVGHVHHGIRGTDADDDLHFVRELARDHEFEFVSERVDTPAIATRTGESLENAARTLRLEAFSRWAERWGLNIVATAHHEDDQVETVLFRIARGTGFRGLTGIPSRRPLVSSDGAGVSVTLVRPLLDWSRAEILAYLGSVRQQYREDATNADTSIARNALRHAILPALESSVHPGSREAILRLARTARQWQLDLDTLLEKRWQALQLETSTTPRGASIYLSLAAFRELPPTLRNAALRRAVDTVAQVSGNVARLLDEGRLQEIARRLGDEDHRRTDVVDLGSGWRVQVDHQALRVSLESAPCPVTADAADKPAPPSADLSIPGSVRWADWTISVETVSTIREFSADDPWVEIIDLDAIAGRRLVVRGRRPGDRFHPLGATGSKSLKEFLRECSVPPEKRDRMPLVTVEDAPSQILWVPGQRLAHPMRVTETTVHCGRLTCRPSNRK